MKKSFILTRLPLASMAAAALLLATSCGSGHEGQEGQDSAQTMTEIPEDKEDLRQVVDEAYPLPTSFDLTQMLNQSGASYILSITNPAANVDKYLTDRQRALNLGIYSADLSYASTYQQTQETMQYMEVTQRLMDELSISSAYNQDLPERIESNLENKDSLVAIITDSFYDTYKYLNQNGNENLSLLVVAGSWTEGAFLASELAITARNNAELRKVLASQKDSFDKLLGILEANMADDANVQSVQTELAKLKPFFEGMTGTEITEKQLEDFHKIVSQVRASFVS